MSPDAGVVIYDSRWDVLDRLIPFLCRNGVAMKRIRGYLFIRSPERWTGDNHATMKLAATKMIQELWHLDPKSFTLDDWKTVLQGRLPEGEQYAR